MAPAGENEIVGPGSCDLSAVVGLLHQTFTALNKCCAILQQDFIETWTILGDIQMTVTGCCANVAVGFKEALIILADIKSTITECCTNITVEFQETWTIINAGFNGTFTAIEGINIDSSGTFSILTDINNTLTICCENIQNNFNGTFTAIASITSPCAATPIIAPTIISMPGYYCLANDIIGTVTITATNATFDLNNHTINAPGTTAIFLSGAANVIVDNGKIDNAAIGVELSLTETINVSNLLITDCSAAAIQFDGQLGFIYSGNIFQDIIIDTCPQFGIIATLNVVSDSLFNKITIKNTGAAIAFQLQSSIFENAKIINCGNNTNITGLFISGGSNNQLINCSVINQQGDGFFIGSDQTIIKNCTVQNIFNSANAVGFNSSGIPNNQYSNCSAINIQSQLGSTGFSTQNSTLENCLVQTCSSITNFNQNVGFTINGSNLLNCQVYQSAGNGFVSGGGGVAGLLENCEAAYNSLDGFQFNSINILVGNCNSFRNEGSGFNVAAVGVIPMYGCFASGNTVTNYVNAPNVVAAGSALRFNNSFI